MVLGQPGLEPTVPPSRPQGEGPHGPTEGVRGCRGRGVSVPCEDMPVTAPSETWDTSPVLGGPHGRLFPGSLCPSREGTGCSGAGTRIQVGRVAAVPRANLPLRGALA